MYNNQKYRNTIQSRRQVMTVRIDDNNVLYPAHNTYWVASHEKHFFFPTESYTSSFLEVLGVQVQLR